MIDLSDIISLDHATTYIRELIMDFHDINVLILANKCDLLRQDFLDSIEVESYIGVEDLMMEDRILGGLSPSCPQQRLYVSLCSLQEDWGYQNGIKWL